MLVGELITALQLLERRPSWRRWELPPEITNDVLVELDRHKLIETRRWTRYLSHNVYADTAFPSKDHPAWQIVSMYQCAGPLEWLLDPRSHEPDCAPEFRLSSIGVDWLRSETQRPAENDQSRVEGGTQIDHVENLVLVNQNNSATIAAKELNVAESIKQINHDHSVHNIVKEETTWAWFRDKVLLPIILPLLVAALLLWLGFKR